MRTLITLTIGMILLMASTEALAKNRPSTQRDHNWEIQQTIFMEKGHATLARSTYFLDIQKVNDQAEETEQALLAELQTITTEEDFSRIVNRLERLEVERELSVLRIQSRYAHGAGMLDLEMKIRSRILHILEVENSR